MEEFVIVFKSNNKEVTITIPDRDFDKLIRAAYDWFIDNKINAEIKIK